MAINFNDLLYFQEIAETKNISRAAERLAVTQPTLSTAIRRLEEELNAQLFTRGKSGVALTNSGRELLRQSREFLTNWNQLKSGISRIASELSGTYSIGCHQTVALHSLSQFLPKLLQDYPDLNIRLEHDLSRLITEKVVSRNLDFGIVVNPVRHPDLTIIKLYTDEVKFWCSKKLKVPETLICDLNLVQVHKLLEKISEPRLKNFRIVQSSSLEVITDLTLNGAGIGILPSCAANRTKGGLVVADKKYPVFHDQISLVYRYDLEKTRASEEIISRIKGSVSYDG